jgi:mRNA interferase MazF
LAIFCSVTSKTKRYPFEVELPAGGNVSGVLLSDQVKSLDWRARRAELIEAVPPEVTDEVLAKLGTLLG